MRKVNWTEEDKDCILKFKARLIAEADHILANPEYLFNEYCKVTGKRKVLVGGIEFFELSRTILKLMSKGAYKIKL